MEERQHATESGSYCFWSTKAICMDFETGIPLGMLEKSRAGERLRSCLQLRLGWFDAVKRSAPKCKFKCK